jgi:hypothetical protein
MYVDYVQECVLITRRIKESDMNINRSVRVIAGFLVLLSLALGAPASPIYVSSYWLWLTVFVGANLFQSGLTNWCLMDKILKKAGVPEA